MIQLSFNFETEVASLFPNNKPIRTLCQLIDAKKEIGRKTGDLEEQLLALVYRYGNPQQWNEVINYMKGWL